MPGRKRKYDLGNGTVVEFAPVEWNDYELVSSYASFDDVPMREFRLVGPEEARARARAYGESIKRPQRRREPVRVLADLERKRKIDLDLE